MKVPKDEKILNIIFSVAGSWKTQLLFNLLSEYWGYYLVSGRVLQNQTSTQTFLKAREELASSDTKYLCEILDRILPLGGWKDWFRPFWSPDAIMSRHAWECLFHNRNNTLRHFEKWQPEYRSERFKSQDWLLFQTACLSYFDPFLDTFKLLLLIDERREIFPFHHNGDNWHMLFCFDEAQCELSDQIENKQKHSFKELLAYLHHDRWEDGDSTSINPGTSLQLQPFKEIVEDNITTAFNTNWTPIGERAIARGVLLTPKLLHAMLSSKNF